MSNRLWCLAVFVYDADLPDFPIVDHRFYGPTQEQCAHWYEVHLSGDAGLKEAIGRRTYKGQACIVKRNMSTVPAHMMHMGVGAVGEEDEG